MERCFIPVMKGCSLLLKESLCPWHWQWCSLGAAGIQCKICWFIYSSNTIYLHLCEWAVIVIFYIQSVIYFWNTSGTMQKVHKQLVYLFKMHSVRYWIILTSLVQFPSVLDGTMLSRHCGRHELRKDRFIGLNHS